MFKRIEDLDVSQLAAGMIFDTELLSYADTVMIGSHYKGKWSKLVSIKDIANSGVIYCECGEIVFNEVKDGNRKISVKNELVENIYIGIDNIQEEGISYLGERLYKGYVYYITYVRNCCDIINDNFRGSRVFIRTSGKGDLRDLSLAL